MAQTFGAGLWAANVGAVLSGPVTWGLTSPYNPLGWGVGPASGPQDHAITCDPVQGKQGGALGHGKAAVLGSTGTKKEKGLTIQREGPTPAGGPEVQPRKLGRDLQAGKF